MGKRSELRRQWRSDMKRLGFTTPFRNWDTKTAKVIEKMMKKAKDV